MNALYPTSAAESYCASAVPGPMYDESTVKERIECLPTRQVNACHVDPIEIGWAPLGAHRQDNNLCWDMVATERLGWAVVNPSVKVRDQGGACTVSGGYYAVVVRKDTPAECPKGYNQRTLSNGEMECWRVPTPCGSCDDPAREQRGNPIEVISLKKIQVETDYRGAGSSTLEFTRTYNSMSYYRPINGPGLAARAFGEYWTHTYERRVYPASGNSHIAATILRPDGEVRYFKADGTDFNAPGSRDRLESIAGGWRFSNGSGFIEDYDTLGVLQSIDDRGRVTTLTYSDANTATSIAPAPGYLISVTEWSGRQLNLHYDSDGRLIAMIAPDGQVTNYEFNGPSAIVTGDQTFTLRMVTKVTYPDNSNRTYYYNEQDRTGNSRLLHALTGLVDEAGVRYASWTYNSSGHAIRSEHAGGVERVDINVNNPRLVTDALGNVTTYTYQQVAGVWRTASKKNPCVGSPCPPAESYLYDSANGDMTRRTDPRGAVTEYSYDPTRHLQTERTEAFGTSRQRVIATQYHPVLALATQIDESGRRTVNTFDSKGRVLTRSIVDLSVTPNVTRTWTYTYNADGQVSSEDGPRTDVQDTTTYAYYQCSTGSQCGQLHTITNARGHVITYNTYNEHGQPLTITDANGVVTTLTYDLRQRLTSRTIGSEQTTFEYWPTGLVKKMTLPDATFMSYTYDQARRLMAIEDSEGNRISYTRDLMSNVTKEEVFDPGNALSGTRTRVFDALLRIQKEIGAAGTAAVTTTYGYDANGNQTSISAPLARNTTQTYDELNRLATVTDPISGVTRYSFDALDQLIAVTDPRNLVSSYSHNAFGEVTRQT